MGDEATICSADSMSKVGAYHYPIEIRFPVAIPNEIVENVAPEAEEFNFRKASFVEPLQSID